MFVNVNDCDGMFVFFVEGDCHRCAAVADAFPVADVLRMMDVTERDVIVVIAELFGIRILQTAYNLLTVRAFLNFMTSHIAAEDREMSRKDNRQVFDV